LLAVACFGVLPAAVAVTLGTGLASAAVALGLGTVTYVIGLVRLRHVVRLSSLFAMRRARAAVTSAVTST
jgi:hypothetical protein